MRRFLHGLHRRLILTLSRLHDTEIDVLLTEIRAHSSRRHLLLVLIFLSQPIITGSHSCLSWF
ncbi:Uncharacterised protein [Vibrio cholerae]|nr:Uncharacterised protein [Vibrio cholerae]